MSDFSDSDYEVDLLDEAFSRAAEHVQHIHSKLSPNDLLELYAYYKQATVGRCNTSKPGVFSMQARAKWCAWNDLGPLCCADAKRTYLEKVQQHDPDWHESIKKGEKAKAAFSWVVHSTQMPPEETHPQAEHEKSVFDYVKEGNMQRVKETLTSKALLELDEHGMGLIHWAADRNAVDILQFLLASGADVNSLDAENQTSLHFAASCGHLDIVRILLSHGADCQMRDADGQTCHDVAENNEIRALLRN